MTTQNRGASLPAISAILARYDRDTLAAFIPVAIDLLDATDGDIDVEPNGDEVDGNFSEDDFVEHGGFGPGCLIADTGMGDRGDHDNCGEYGLDQRSLACRAAAFVSINGMSLGGIDIASTPNGWRGLTAA